MATVTPSPSAVALERAVADRGAGIAAEAAPAPVESPAPANLPEESQALFDALKAAAEQIESYLRSTGRELKFSVDEPTGRTVVTVRDSQNGEVIRQIPNEEALRLARSLGSQPNALIDISI
jgi:flagellar protein FlaG